MDGVPYFVIDVTFELKVKVMMEFAVVSSFRNTYVLTVSFSNWMLCKFLTYMKLLSTVS